MEKGTEEAAEKAAPFNPPSVSPYVCEGRRGTKHGGGRRRRGQTQLSRVGGEGGIHLLLPFLQLVILLVVYVCECAYLLSAPVVVHTVQYVLVRLRTSTYSYVEVYYPHSCCLGSSPSHTYLLTYSTHCFFLLRFLSLSLSA